MELPNESPKETLKGRRDLKRGLSESALLSVFPVCKLVPKVFG